VLRARRFHRRPQHQQHRHSCLNVRRSCLRGSQHISRSFGVRWRSSHRFGTAAIARTLRALRAAGRHDSPPSQSGGPATALQSASHETDATLTLTSSYPVIPRLSSNPAVNCRNAVRCFANGNAPFPNDKSGFDSLPRWSLNGRRWFTNGDGPFTNDGGPFTNGDGSFANGRRSFWNGYGSFLKGRRSFAGAFLTFRQRRWL